MPPSKIEALVRRDGRASMKVVLSLLFGVLGLAGLGLLINSDASGPDLVDASGSALTPGLAKSPARFPDSAASAASAPGGEPGSSESSRAEADPFEAVEALREARDFAGAKARLLELLAESDRDGETCTALSEVCRELGELDEASDFAEKAVALVPDLPAAHVAHARALGAQLQRDMQSVAGMLRAMGRLGEFRGAIERALELDPDDLDGRKLELMLHLAPAPIGDLDRALELSRAMEELDAVSGLYWRAVVHQRREETEEALALCREGRGRFPEEAGFPLLHGQLLLHGGEVEAADECFRSIQESPEMADAVEFHQARYERAKLRIEEGFELEQALELLDAYLEASPRGDFLPQPAHALWRKGMALEGLGRREEALAAYRESVRLDPEFSSSKEALAKLEAAG